VLSKGRTKRTPPHTARHGDRPPLTHFSIFTYHAGMWRRRCVEGVWGWPPAHHYLGGLRGGEPWRMNLVFDPKGVQMSVGSKYHHICHTTSTYPVHPANLLSCWASVCVDQKYVLDVLPLLHHVPHQVIAPDLFDAPQVPQDCEDVLSCGIHPQQVQGLQIVV